MATIKAFSDLEQSRKLAEILPLESADMYYISGDECDICFGSGVYEEIADWLSDGTSRPADIPCWSLASLLDVLPYPQLSKDKLGSGKVGWMVSVYPNDCRYDSCWHDNPVDTCVDIIEKLHELKML